MFEIVSVMIFDELMKLLLNLIKIISRKIDIGKMNEAF